MIQRYTPQQDRSTEKKGDFYEMLQTTVDGTTDKENLIIVSDSNRHGGIDRQDKEEIIGSFEIDDKCRWRKSY